MSTAQWLQLIGTIVVVAVGYGALAQKVTQLREELREVKQGQRHQGERLGKVETDMAIQKALGGRRPTRALEPVQATPAEGEDHG